MYSTVPTHQAWLSAIVAAIVVAGASSVGATELADRYKTHGSIEVPVLSTGDRTTSDFALSMEFKVGSNAFLGKSEGSYTAKLSTGESCSGDLKIQNFGVYRITLSGGSCAAINLAPKNGDILDCGFDSASSNDRMSCTYTQGGLIDRDVNLREW